MINIYEYFHYSVLGVEESILGTPKVGHRDRENTETPDEKIELIWSQWVHIHLTLVPLRSSLACGRAPLGA